MTKPKDVEQIGDYIGKEIVVDLKTGRKVIGRLSFFNWDQQVVHVNAYHILNNDGMEIDKGKFIIINQRDWESVRAK